jgi:hypothetical protein
MKKCQMLGLVLVGLLSKTALGAAVPPGYPVDSVGYAPSQNSRVVYLCRENIWNIKFQTPEKITASACFEKMEIAIAAVNTDTDWYANCVKHESVTKPSMICDRFKKYYNYSGKNDVRTILVGTVMIGDLVNKQNISNPFCPPSEALIMFSEGHDTNGDGKIDLCFNPADKLKERVKVSDNICWKKGAPTVSTPNTSDEDRIKAAAKSALDALNSLDRDMKNPDGATDKTKLDAIAQSFSLNGYQDPDFHILASLISTEAGCMRPKLEGIITDPQGHNIRINDYEGGFYGVNCKMPVGSEVIDFTELSKKLFTGYTSELSPTISHEVHHRCNGRDDLTDNGLGLTTAQIESERIDFLNTSVSRFKSSISRGDGESAKKYWARVFITNAYVFEDIMKVYR